MSLSVKAMETIERIKTIIDEVVREVYVIEASLCDIAKALNINSENVRIMCEIYDEN